MASLPTGRYSVLNEESTRKKEEEEEESAPNRKGEESIQKIEGEKSIPKTEEGSIPKAEEEGDPTTLTGEESSAKTEEEESTSRTEEEESTHNTEAEEEEESTHRTEEEEEESTHNTEAEVEEEEESTHRTEDEEESTHRAEEEEESTHRSEEEESTHRSEEESTTHRSEEEEDDDEETEESTPSPREKEEVPIGERKLEQEAAGELTDRGEDALVLRNFTEAVNCFEKALRIRISDENNPAPGASYAMLKYAEAWFLKNREVSKSATCGEPLAKFKNVNRAISKEILQKLPDGSAEDVRSLSILLAEANKKAMNEAISNGTSVADQLLLDETEGIVTAHFVPAFKILQLSTMLDEEQLGTLSTKYQGDDRTAEPANATGK